MLITALKVPIVLVPSGKEQESMEKRVGWKISYDHLLTTGIFSLLKEL